jgi:hypothetical protein
MTVRKTPTLRKRRRVNFAAPAPSKSERVTFALNEQRYPLNESKSFLSTEEINNRWYSKDEEQSFKQSAIKELSDFRRKSLMQKNSTDLSVQMFPRGLEKYSKERRFHKKDTIRLVLMAHRRGLHPDHVALLAQQRSSWNTDIATTQASLDHVEVLIGDSENCAFM